MIKAVIFDFDDTLVESRLAKWAHHKHVAKKFYNIDLKETKLLEHWGKPFDRLVCELYENRDTLEKMLEANISVRKDFPKKPYKESADVVKKLVNNNFKVSVLSAATKEYIVEDLIKFNFPIEKFLTVQGFKETSVHKPNPNVFLPIFEKLEKEGIKKKEIVYVGDSMDDMEAANAAGIHFIAVTKGLYSEDDFKKRGVKIILKDLTKLPKLIKELK